MSLKGFVSVSVVELSSGGSATDGATPSSYNYRTPIGVNIPNTYLSVSPLTFEVINGVVGSEPLIH